MKDKQNKDLKDRFEDLKDRFEIIKMNIGEYDLDEYLKLLEEFKDDIRAEIEVITDAEKCFDAVEAHKAVMEFIENGRI